MPIRRPRLTEIANVDNGRVVKEPGGDGIGRGLWRLGRGLAADVGEAAVTRLARRLVAVERLHMGVGRAGRIRALRTKAGGGELGFELLDAASQGHIGSAVVRG